jgi:NhaP-type Na+/H+ or K+/H+ antiporter
MLSDTRRQSARLAFSLLDRAADGLVYTPLTSGRFAEEHVPLSVRNIIVAEAGANDGLGFPFLFIALYLILIHEPTHPWHTVGGAVLEW